MHTVELLEEALELAGRLGYQVREEWLGGSGGGGCELKGRKILFLDLALAPVDQLDQVVQTLHREPNVAALAMGHQLRQLMDVRKSA